MTNHLFKYTVCIKCMTYNHASFIEDAMNGFTMQQTDFPFVCIIVDDASTDGEQDVIRQYLSNHFNLEDNNVVRQEETDDYYLTHAQHKTNLNCYFTVLLLKYNHYKKKAKGPYFKEWTENVKYVATCEGDDYWIYPHKLQEQVDFLENNFDYSLCCHNVYLLIHNKIKQKDVPESIRDQDFSFTNKENLDFWMTETSSVLFRNELYKKVPFSQYRFIRDTHIIYHLLRQGKGYCFAFYGSVYRHHPSGIYSMTDSFEKKLNAYYTYKELLRFNEDDDVLKAYLIQFNSSFFSTLRQKAYEGNISRSFLKAIHVYSKDIGKENGLRAKILVLWKLFKSYFRGKTESKN